MASQAGLITPRLKQPQATVDKLRERIQDGHYIVGERLPAERELTEDLRVHRRIVRAAIVQLEKEGLLNRRPNCRPIVQANHPTPTMTAEFQTPASRLVAFVMYQEEGQDRADTGQKRMFWGMNQALGRAGYHAVFLELGGTVDTPEQKFEFEAHHMRYALEHGFGGVVFYAYSHNRNRDLIREVSRRLPLILIDRMVPGVDVDYVGLQNHGAMLEATNYAIAQGHQRIAYVTTNDAINTVQDRLQGYLEAMQTAFPDKYYEMVLPLPAVGGSWPLFNTVFKLPDYERPTALICVNDYEAAHAAYRLGQLGLKVPEDVSIIGCDNIVESLSPSVGLTTIEQPFDEIGREAARLFIRRIKSPDSLPSFVEVPSKLIIRDSVIKLN